MNKQAIPIITGIEESKSENTYPSLIKGYVLACTNKSEKQLIESGVFCTGRAYGHKVMAVKKGDIVFLLNIDTDELIGPFIAKSEGDYNPEKSPFGSKYPYIVEVVSDGTTIHRLSNAKNLFKKLNINWRSDILSEKGVQLIKQLVLRKKDIGTLRIKNKETLIAKNYRPPLFSTTLWDYPYQSYGDTPKGNNKYPGVTPAFIIYNMLYRYTIPGDTVLDPMTGSGTTIDVCKEEKRNVIAFDIVPTRPDIKQADARNLPLPDESIDMVFIDSPYGDNIRYNDHPDNIGHIPATDEAFYDELEKVMKECYRVMKPGKYLGWLIGDQWAKKHFVPVGFKIYERLTKYFEPVDIISVVRRNQASNTPIWHRRAIEHNFYLRGFKYLIIVRKPDKDSSSKKKDLNIKWNFYER